MTRYAELDAQMTRFRSVLAAVARAIAVCFTRHSASPPAARRQAEIIAGNTKAPARAGAKLALIAVRGPTLPHQIQADCMVRVNSASRELRGPRRELKLDAK
jgi:hypothetical protein